MVFMMTLVVVVVESVVMMFRVVTNVGSVVSRTKSSKGAILKRSK